MGVKAETSAMSWSRERVQTRSRAGHRGVWVQDRQVVGPQVWAETGQVPPLSPPSAEPGMDLGDGAGAVRTTAIK